MSLTKFSLGGNYDVIYKLFQPRESLVSDIPAGDGNIEKNFFTVHIHLFIDVIYFLNINTEGGIHMVVSQ